MQFQKSTVMKILIINHNAGSIYHGPNLRTYYASKELVQKYGHDVTLASSSYSHKYSVLPKASGVVTDENIDGVNFKWIKCIKYTNLFQRIYSHFEFGLKLLFNRKKICQEADLVIFSGPPPEIFFFSWIYAKILKVPIISDVRDLWPLTQIEMSKLQWLNPFIYFLYFSQYCLVKGSNHLLSPLPGVGLYFKKICLDAKTTVIENGFDLNREILDKEITLNVIASGTSVGFNKGASIVLSDIQFHKKFIVGYSGSFDRDNDLDSLIEAAKQLKNRKDILFMFVGAGKRLGFLANATLEIPNLLVCNRVPSESVPNILKIMDVCYCGLKPKNIYKYGVSLAKTYEYMASAKPIIWMIDAYNNPVRESGGGFLVEPENIEELVQIIDTSSRMDKEELYKFGQKGYKYLENNYSYEVLGSKWNNLIKEVGNYDEK